MPKRSAETYPGQRNKEKRALFQQFRCRLIEDVYRKRFFALFGNRCFKCGRPEKEQQEIGSPPNLCIDHHLPMALGGHLVPGNLVSLCRDCNNRKLDTSPVAFYSNDELKRLEPLLEAQHALFRFELDWDRWLEDREAYLIELGVDPADAKAALYDEDDHRFIGPGRSAQDSERREHTMAIRLNVEKILQQWEKSSADTCERTAPKDGLTTGDA